MLLNAAKDVTSALSDLINATKNASGKAANDPAMDTLKSAAKVWLSWTFVLVCSIRLNQPFIYQVN